MKYVYLCVLCILCVEVAVASNQAALDHAKETVQAGRYIAAIEELQTLLESEQDNYQAWFLFGVSHALKQQYNQAIEAFRQVIVLRPDLAEPHNNLAGVYNALGDPKMAIVELEKALEKKPQYAIAEENIANLYIDLALKHYRNSLEKSPNIAVEQRFSRLLQVRNPVATDAGNINAALKQQALTPSIVSAKKAPTTTTSESTQDTSSLSPPVVANKSTHETAALAMTDVLDALEAWRVAWSAQDLPTYFAAYDIAYQPAARFASRQAWQAYKTRVIQNKTFIQVHFEQVEVNMSGQDKRATVLLLQRFRSNSYNGDGHKKITLQYGEHGWKIIAEVSI